MRNGKTKIYENYIKYTFNDDSLLNESKVTVHKYRLERFFPKDIGSHLLEIGVGKGELIYLLKKLGYENIEGIDISEDAVEHCNSIFKDGTVRLVEDPTEYLRDKVEKYDVVFMIDVLEHMSVDSAVRLLKSVHSSLKKRGLLVIQTPNMNSLFPAVSRYHDITHEFCYQENSLAQLLRACGFSQYTFYESLFPPKRTIKNKAKRVAQKILYRTVRLIRLIDDSRKGLRILTPNIIAVAKK